MKITVKFGLGFAALWIAYKMFLFYTATGVARYTLDIPILLNVMCLLLSMTFGLYLHKRRQTVATTALDDIKSSMTAGVPYTIIISVFLYFYYTSIDPEFNKHQLTESEVLLDNVMNDPAKLKELKAGNADYEIMTDEEIREQQISNQRAMFSAKSAMTVSLLGMLILSTINSIFITVVYRKLIFRDRVVRPPTS
ncbi:MAG: hypothetical protein ACI865_003133 [Flavobacteriaceae bacterium]|jgi:hypothetical protein